MQKKHPRIAKLDEIKQLNKHDQLHFLFENNEINSIKILGESSISYKNEYKTRPVNNWSALENTWNQRVNKIRDIPHISTLGYLNNALLTSKNYAMSTLLCKP